MNTPKALDLYISRGWIVWYTELYLNKAFKKKRNENLNNNYVTCLLGLHLIVNSPGQESLVYLITLHLPKGSKKA